MFDISTSELNTFLSMGKTVLDVAIVYYLMYKILLILKGTRAAQILLGMVFIVVLFLISKEDFLNLQTVNWILEKFIGSFIIIIVIIFQDDIRKALGGLWKKPMIRTGSIVRPVSSRTSRITAAVVVSPRSQ